MLLRQVFKTYDGALKRCRFENAIARDKVSYPHHDFRIVKVPAGYQLERTLIRSANYKDH